MLRPVRDSDLDLICRHREAMFREAGRADADVSAMAGPFRIWADQRLRDGRYFGFIAEDGGEAVAGIGMMVLDWPPHPSHPGEGRRGYVLNLFVEPTYRGKGIATALMRAAEQEFATRNITFLVLHATDAGRPVYEKIGWLPTTEMAKALEDGAIGDRR